MKLIGFKILLCFHFAEFSSDIVMSSLGIISKITKLRGCGVYYVDEQNFYIEKLHDKDTYHIYLF